MRCSRRGDLRNVVSSPKNNLPPNFFQLFKMTRELFREVEDDKTNEVRSFCLRSDHDQHELIASADC